MKKTIKVIQVVNDEGRKFTVRRVDMGDNYGLDDCLTHEKTDPLIEFYDASQCKDSFGERGQFVSRYYASTLRERERNTGLNLDVGVPGWHVSGENMDEIADTLIR